jgi:TonB family protein
LAEAPRPAAPPAPPRPEAPPPVEAFPPEPLPAETPVEEILVPPTELRLPDRFAQPLPSRPPPRPQPQQQAPQQQAQAPRPPLTPVLPEGPVFGPPAPPAGRPQGRGLDTRVDPRFAEGRATADPSVRVTGAQVGADWRAAFRRWLEQNIRYPDRAIQLGEDGQVRVQVIAAPDGTVRSVRMVLPSTSPSLNFATTFPFQQGARIPAFPPPADPNGVTIDLTVNFILIRR